MLVKCPTCKRLHEYDTKSQWRPFCSERCKIIDLGAWASGAYKIEGEPGTADPELLAEEARKQLSEKGNNSSR